MWHLCGYSTGLRDAAEGIEPARSHSSLKNHPHRELNLPGGIGVCGFKEVRRLLVGSGEVLETNAVIKLDDLSCTILKTIVGDCHSLVIAIE